MEDEQSQSTQDALIEESYVCPPSNKTTQQTESGGDPTCINTRTGADLNLAPVLSAGRVHG